MICAPQPRRAGGLPSPVHGPGSGQRTQPSSSCSPVLRVTWPRWVYKRPSPLPSPRGRGSWRDVHVDGLPLGEELSRRLALLARAGGRLLHAAEGDVELEAGRLLIHLDDAGADVGGEAEGFAEVAGEDGGGETEGGVVGELNGFFI